jgi:hypothetical protein
MADDVDLPLHHHFEVSGLYINPIIHGPPLRRVDKKKEEVYMLQALSKHKCNALFVYDHYTGSYGASQQAGAGEEEGTKKVSWAAPSLDKVMQLAGRRREEMVTFAGLGKMMPGMDFERELASRLAEARERVGLSHIDYAVVEFDEDSFAGGGEALDAAVMALESLCRNSNNNSGEGERGLLQGYGLHVAVEPYTHHCPPKSKGGRLAILPSMVESGIGMEHYSSDDDDTNQQQQQQQQRPTAAEMVVYACSPSTALPATYPMLEPSIETWDNSLIEPRADEDLESMGLGEEALADARLLRTKVRALGEAGRRFSRLALNPVLCYRGGTDTSNNSTTGGGVNAGSNNTPEIEGEDADVGYLQELSKEWEAQNQDRDVQREIMTTTTSVTGGANDDYVRGMALAPNTEGGALRLLVSPYRDTNKQAKTEQGRAAVFAQAAQEEEIGDALDELCPRLADGASPLLQLKALRAVFSVGFDAAVLDAESSAHFGKLTLGPQDLLDSSETDALFGQFEIPPGMTEQ